MNEYWILAFVVTPAIVLLLGYAAMVLHGREADRLERERKAAADRG